MLSSLHVAASLDILLKLWKFETITSHCTVKGQHLLFKEFGSIYRPTENCKTDTTGFSHVIGIYCSHKNIRIAMEQGRMLTASFLHFK